MNEPILHQYAASPFSEKIRKVFGFKKMAWRAVDQPMVAPKPKLTPLTGGYRKIPVLQIGADVYCDTVAIARRLEELAPEPTLYPAAGRGVAEIVAQWADHRLFLAVVPPVIVDILPALPPEFVADRQKMSPAFTRENLERGLPEARSQIVVGLEWLERQLRGGRFIVGDAFSLADAAVFHNLWFLRSSPAAFALVEQRSALHDWFQRVDAIGQGSPRDLDADEALAIARRATPDTTPFSDGADPNGLRPGDEVVVQPDDYGTETTSGTLVRVTVDEIAVRREDAAVGEVVVHFPRSGFRVTRRA